MMTTGDDDDDDDDGWRWWWWLEAELYDHRNSFLRLVIFESFLASSLLFLFRFITTVGTVFTTSMVPAKRVFIYLPRTVWWWDWRGSVVREFGKEFWCQNFFHFFSCPSYHPNRKTSFFCCWNNKSQVIRETITFHKQCALIGSFSPSNCLRVLHFSLLEKKASVFFPVMRFIFYPHTVHCTSLSSFVLLSPFLPVRLLCLLTHLSWGRDTLRNDCLVCSLYS